MKKFFKCLGIITLLCGSFIYTEKTASVVKEMDEIMIKIKEESEKYYIKPIEAIIEEDTIIPGINGIEINVNKSYSQMRSIGIYSDKYLKYSTIKVENSLDDNKDKYIIGGNANKGIVSLVFIVENNDSIDNIIQTLSLNKINASFFIDGTWLEKNNTKVYDIVRNNHNLGSIGYDYNYSDSSYPWLDNIIKKVSKEKNSYCLKVDTENINICKLNNNYTISEEIISNNYLINTKEKIKSGKIFIYKLSSSLESELPFIIKYINSKGFKIDNLKILLSE